MLSRGIELGLGTGSLTGEDCRRTVKDGLDIGYRHIDTARAYENEREIGDALATADIDREDVFVATKIHSKDLSYEDAIHSAEQSRDQLGIETIDLLYVHWPAHTYDPDETMAAFETLCERGVIRRVGVSNFTRELLAEAISVSTVPIFANQVEMHPFLRQEVLHEYAVENDVLLVAHSPFAGGATFDDPTLVRIADEHDASVAEVTLAWLLEKENIAVIPRATGSHLTQNYGARSLSLGAESLEIIDSIDRELRVVEYDFSPWDRTN